MEYLCPDCRLPLHQETYHDVAFYECAECAGLWFTAGALDQVRNTSTTALVEIEQAFIPRVIIFSVPTGRSCPMCVESLGRCRFQTDSPIDIDICTKCKGLWVPDGELTRIAHIVENSRDMALITANAKEETVACFAAISAEHAHFMRRQQNIQFTCHVITKCLRLLGRNHY